jgi:23S rRNA pseudouridine2605 synthase
MLSDNLTLLKLLVAAGKGSRREIARLIKEGRVAANGQIVEDFKFGIDIQKDEVTIDGHKVKLELYGKIVIMMNKPVDIISTTSDEHGRKTIIDILPPKYQGQGLYPAGRLDKDTTGLIILTNDGDITYQITHPKFEFEKEYLAYTNDELNNEEINLLEKGIALDDGVTSPAIIKKIKQSPYNYSITIHQGRKRQVRRMFEELGHPVLALKRVRIGNLNLDKLAEGQVRELTGTEIKILLATASTH